MESENDVLYIVHVAKVLWKDLKFYCNDVYKDTHTYTH
jgi:hypothetical protein